MSAEDVESDEPEDFYFESDHLALRGNKDYHSVLRAYSMLQAQRARVLRNIEELHELQAKYTKNPELLLEKLRKGEEIVPNNRMTIVEVPQLKGYDLSGQPKQKQEFVLQPAGIKIKQEATAEPCAPNVVLEKVRGRAVLDSKSKTFNKLWSFDEQRRLEELLIEYPPETVEVRRYTKIAEALGTRTPQQVASRVQKYFKKLHDAGMPIPGRTPKSRRPGSHGKSKRFQIKQSTFFPSYNVPVHMQEDDDYVMNDMMSARASPQTTFSGDSDNANQEPMERTIALLKIIRDEKELHPFGYNPDPMASSCSGCISEPVSTLNWRCKSCNIFLNVCNDCLVHQLLSRTFTHILHDVVHDNEDKP